MPEMSVNEWAAAYRALNRAEHEMLMRDLQSLSPQESILRYLRLCEFIARLSPNAREAFEEERSRHYQALEERMIKAARKSGYDLPD